MEFFFLFFSFFSQYGIVNQPFIYPFFIYCQWLLLQKVFFRFSSTNLNLFILKPSEQFLKENARRSFLHILRIFFVFLGTELSTSFLLNRHWLLQKVFFSFSLTNSKFSVNVCSFLGFPSVEIKSDDGYQIGRGISSDIHCPILYHVISFIQ